MADGFKNGDLVWAKMKGFPPWPGRVSNPPKDLKKPSGKKGAIHCIFFFGTENYAWIEESNLKPYLEFKDALVKSNKSGAFRDAVEAIEKYVENKGEESTGKIILKRAYGDRSPVAAKRKKKADADAIDSSGISSEVTNGDDSGPYSNHSLVRKGRCILLERPANIVRPDTPPLDLENVSKTLKEKNILPSQLKFGFLGLGIMGSGIVKNLLNSGHSVIVWNRTPEKSESC